MSHTLLLSLPKGETWDMEHFLQESLSCCKAGASFLRGCSEKVEDAVKELLQLIRSTAPLPQVNSFDSDEIIKSKKEELELFETECEDLFMHFQHRNLDAMASSVRCTLEKLRHCITSTSHYTAVIHQDNSSSLDKNLLPASCFQADLVLTIPNVVMHPSLEDVQNAVNEAVLHVCEVGQHVRQWTPPHAHSFTTHPGEACKTSIT